MEYFLKGFILGFSIAAPVGPIGILCIRKTLQFGRWSGLCSGLGAACADTLYGFIAVFGLNALSIFLIEAQEWIRLLGGAFLLYVGFKTVRSEPYKKMKPVTRLTLLKDFFTTFMLTLTNPMTILSFMAIIAGFGLLDGKIHQGGWLILGVLTGSALWWLILSAGVTLFRHKMSPPVMLWINRIAGTLIVCFGLWACFSAYLR